MFLNLTVDRRSSTSAAQTTPLAPSIGPLKAGHDVVVVVNDSSEGTSPVAVGDINVDRYVPNNLPAPYGSGSVAEHVQTTNHFRPDTAPDVPFIVGCGTTTPCVVLVAFGSDSTPINANYTFTDIRAGHNIAVFHTSTATEITYKAFTDVDASWLDDETTVSHGLSDDSGKIDMLTNGSIWVIEQSGAGDLRVGHIHSTGVCTGPSALCVNPIEANVVLESPKRILDAELDAGVLDTDDDPTCVDAYDLDCSLGTPNSIDVTARHIIMRAGNNGLAQPGSVSGYGGIGLPDNFLEINVDAAGAPLGVLDALDTAADDDNTLGIYLDEISGDMKVDTVWTAGDNALDTGNVSLRSRAGSIVDARSGGSGDSAANVFGQSIDIDAHGGSIGDTGGGNDFEIDSLRGSPFVCTNINCTDLSNGQSDPGLAVTADDVALEAQTGIYLTETNAYLRLVLAHATTGNIRLTVRESTPDTDEDLYLIEDGSAQFAEDNDTAPGDDNDALRIIPRGQIFAETGSVELRVGDDVTLHQASEILANLSIDIRGDFVNLDTGGLPDEYGTTMILRGRIIADCVVDSGDLTGHPVGTCDSSADNPVVGRQIQIWGHTDVDIFQFGDSSGLDPAGVDPLTDHGDDGYIFLGAKSIVRGSQNVSSTGDDGEDEFTVWYLFATT
jgi:hypothetical protein